MLSSRQSVTGQRKQADTCIILPHKTKQSFGSVFQCSLYASLGYSNLFDWLTFKNVNSGVLRQTAGLISQHMGCILLYACDSGAIKHSHTFRKWWHFLFWEGGIWFPDFFFCLKSCCHFLTEATYRFQCLVLDKGRVIRHLVIYLLEFSEEKMP